MHLMASSLNGQPASDVRAVGDVVENILSLALEHPGWSCARLISYLQIQNISVSARAVRNILHKHDMGTKAKRILKLQRKAEEGTVQLSAEQLHWLQRAYP